MKTVLTYGTFDLFHVGHVNLLKRLASYGDRLIVGLSTDEFNNTKGKKSFFSYNDRYQILSSCKYVNFVFPENTWEQKIDDIKKYECDIFAIGDDWKGKFDFLKDYCEVLYLPRTKDISTTEIKKQLSEINIEELESIESTLASVIDVVKNLSKAY
ncbi:glycerol-3-phosphate cytidylyltransferase [Aliikangiella sp. IMCC44632]